ncbi:MAG: glutamine amidotransferase [Actinomycetes bacterium]
MTSDSTLLVVAVYPAVLGTYGDAGNAAILTARARQHGLDVRLHVVEPFAPVPADGDVYLLGGSDDAAQSGAADALRAQGGLARAVDRGAAVFAVCAGFQLLGESFPAGDRQVAGLGLLDADSRRLASRAVGELLIQPGVPSDLPELTGYENHASGTTLGPAAAPLGTVEMGIGNGDGGDGARQGRITATYLHGPALARNVVLADHVLQQVVGTLPALPYPPYADRLRAERIRAARSRADRPRAPLQELFEQIGRRSRRRRSRP